tara:strand:+ start:2028 stop:2612 length:585 start_codon:yes stop_codon:yes gene_type:complete
LGKRNKSNDYIDNKEFFKSMIVWKDLVIEAESCDDPRPPVSDYIGECFMKIAEHLSYRPNFINYPYREEMVGDGIENCLMYAHNFNPEKSKNPFSYFTQIIYYAFLRRIEKEKKQNYIKYKLLENATDSSINKWFRENYFEKTKDNNEVKDVLSKHFQLSDTDIKKFEPKKKKKTKKNLDVFLEDDKSEDSTAE